MNSGDYKMLGLTPNGNAKYTLTILYNFMDAESDVSSRIEQSYSNYCAGLNMISGRFDNLYGGPLRSPEEHMGQKHIDLAANAQTATKEVSWV